MMMAHPFLVRSNYQGKGLTPVEGLVLSQSTQHQFDTPRHMFAAMKTAFTDSETFRTDLENVLGTSWKEFEGGLARMDDCHTKVGAISDADTIIATVGEIVMASLLTAALDEEDSEVHEQEGPDDNEMQTVCGHMNALTAYLDNGALSPEERASGLSALNEATKKMDAMTKILKARALTSRRVKSKVPASTTTTTTTEQNLEVRKSARQEKAAAATTASSPMPSMTRSTTVNATTTLTDPKMSINNDIERVLSITSDPSLYDCASKNGLTSSFPKGMIPVTLIQRYEQRQKDRASYKKKMRDVIDMSYEGQESKIREKTEKISHGEFVEEHVQRSMRCNRVDDVGTHRFFHRIVATEEGGNMLENEKQRHRPVFGEKMRETDVYQTRSETYGGCILSSTFGDSVESEFFQPGVYYNSASKQMFGAFAKKNFKVTQLVLNQLQTEPACHLKGIPLSEELMAEEHVTNDMVLNWCERAGGMRSQFSVWHQNQKYVVVSLAVSLFTSVNSAGLDTSSRGYRKIMWECGLNEEFSTLAVDEKLRKFFKDHPLMLKCIPHELMVYKDPTDETRKLEELESINVPLVRMLPPIGTEFRTNEEIFSSYPLPNDEEVMSVLSTSHESYTNSK